MAPAGNFPMLSTAVKAGADAVYFGLNDFSMRASSKNFAISELEEMREICNSSDRSVKMYLTLNTIIYDDEIEQLQEVITEIKGKVDAVICWDHAVMNLCRHHKIPFFISTQASVANRAAAEFYKNLGAERVVLARELNLTQIKSISNVIDVECFVHGAMCVAISGRCFMSQFTHKKSANRGECYQNCRRSYTIIDDSGNELQLENSRVMSAKDLCALSLIKQMKDAGVMSYKIEGRGRDPRYVDVVTRAYRRALDNNLSDNEIADEIKELEKVFNRQFSTGFYLEVPSKEGFSTADNNNATETKTTLGKVTNYYSRNKVAAIHLLADLNIGDEIIIIGNKTGVEKIKVEKIEIDGKPVDKGRKGERVGIRIPGVRKNDSVFKILKKVKITVH